MRPLFYAHTKRGLIDFLFGHGMPLSTLASRYVFAHNEVYHIKASVFAKNWCFLNFFLK